MKHIRLERGTVVSCGGQYFLIWAYSGGRYGDPVALPVLAQTGPRHRSHVRLTGSKALGLPERSTMVVRTLEARQVPGRECRQIGQCGFELITQIDLTMRRATEAEARERPPLIF